MAYWRDWVWYRVRAVIALVYWIALGLRKYPDMELSRWQMVKLSWSSWTSVPEWKHKRQNWKTVQEVIAELERKER